jgi:hypothetical protein
MATITKNLWTTSKIEVENNLLIWVEAFLVDCNAQELSEGVFYRVPKTFPYCGKLIRYNLQCSSFKLFETRA